MPISKRSIRFWSRNPLLLRLKPRPFLSENKVSIRKRFYINKWLPCLSGNCWLNKEGLPIDFPSRQQPSPLALFDL